MPEHQSTKYVETLTDGAQTGFIWRLSACAPYEAEARLVLGPGPPARDVFPVLYVSWTVSVERGRRSLRAQAGAHGKIVVASIEEADRLIETVVLPAHARCLRSVEAALATVEESD